MDRRDFMKSVALGTAAMGAASIGCATGSGDAGAASSASAGGIGLEPDIAGDLTFDAAEYAGRYERIRAGMEDLGLSALIVGGNRDWREGELGNLRYIGAHVDWEPTFAILLLAGEPLMPVKKGGLAPPMGAGGHVPFELFPSGVRPDTRNSADHTPAIAAMMKKLGLDGKRIGLVSPRVLPAELVIQLGQTVPNAELVDAERLFLELRYTKSEQELKFLRRSAYCADKGIEALVAAAEVGASDWDLFFAMDQAATEAGAPPGGMQLLDTGPWTGPRSHPFFDGTSARNLAPGDVIIPEVTSNYKGYFTQLTVPVVLGEAGPEFQVALDLCDRVYPWITEQYVPGKTVLGIDRATAEYTKKVSNGAFMTLFGIQAGEHEASFWHDDIQLGPDMLAYNQPFFMSTKGPPPFHVYGDAMITQASGPPIRLHKTPMAAVHKS